MYNIVNEKGGNPFFLQLPAAHSHILVNIWTTILTFIFLSI